MPLDKGSLIAHVPAILKCSSRVHSRGFTSLPIIDISPLMGKGQADEKYKVGQELHEACRDVGFFYVTNHGALGVPASVTDGVLKEARAWFSLPVHEKQKIALRPDTAFRGYQRLGDNVTRYDGGFQRDHHEAIDLYKEEPNQTSSPVHGMNQWPNQRPSFDASLRQYISSCLGVGQIVMRGIALGLGLPETYFETPEGGGTTVETSYWVMRTIHYPPLAQSDKGLQGAASQAFDGCEVSRDVQLSCGEHTDYGLLTLVNQDPHIPALQVKNAKGQWITAAPIPGTFVCNVGDMLKVYTNGLYEPTPHRVINADPSRSRVSIPFFYEPAFEAEVRPVNALVPEGTPPKFAPVCYGRHLESKVLNNFELEPPLSEQHERCALMKLSLSQEAPQANVRHLIRQFDPRMGELPPAKWMEVPFDVMREVVRRLAVHDVQTTLLVCREWHEGFASGLVSMRPRVLKLHHLAARFPALQQLDVSACRRVSNDELAHLHMMTNLRSVVLSGCEDISDEGMLHLTPLTQITSLNLANCCKVTDSGLLAMSALTQLRTLDLSGCVSVTERGLAVLAAALRRLQTLKLGGTSRVATIGNGSIAAISALTSLTHLDLSGSHDITDTGLWHLSSLSRLRTLVLWNCMRVSVEGLEVFRHLPCVSDLSLRGCAQLSDALCSSIAYLGSLVRLDIRACERFTGANMREWRHLRHLQELNLKGCYKIEDAGLQGLSLLTGLTSINMQECWQITADGLSALSGLKGMADINLQGCRKITSLDPLGGLNRLTALNLRNCDGLGDAALDPLNHLLSLKSLDLSGCTHLTGRGLLPLSGLTGLTALKLQHCQGIRRSCDLAPLSLLTGLSMLNLSGCSQTEGAGISSLCTLTSLRALSLDGWRHVTFIDDGLMALTSLKGVQSLNLQGCISLTDVGLAAIAHMTSLTCVNLQDCRQITGEGFAGWSGMQHLTSLSLQNASLVSDLGCAAIAKISSLRALNLKNCPALTDNSLAALAPLQRLCHLRLQGNQQLSDLALGHCARLASLQHLETSNCWHMTDCGLFRLTCLTALAHLDLSYCWQVTDRGVEGLVRSLTSLVTLNVIGCHRLTPRAKGQVARLLDNPFNI